MDVTVKDFRVESERRAIDRVITRCGLRGNDIGLWYKSGPDRETTQAREHAWTAVKGIWNSHRFDPVRFQRKIRKESDRRLP